MSALAMARPLCAAALLALGATAHAAVSADEISAMPGLPPPGTFSSKQYSGYLDVGQGKHLHYWLVESEKTPAKDPLVVWFNGGPGCSSLDGYFYEHGPYHVTEPVVNTSGVPQLFQNPHRWNKVANVMFLEAPAGVGFSYADTPAGTQHNDTSTAMDNYQALSTFFEGFPELSDNDFYIAGESYAGAYVPMLAMQVLSHNKLSSAKKINLKGIMVGNGVTGQDSIPQDVGAKAKVEFFYGHGLYNDSLHTAIISACGDFKHPSSTCQSLQGEMHTQLGNVNVYDIYWPCHNGGMDSFSPATQLDASSSGMGMLGGSLALTQQRGQGSLGEGGPVGCIDATAAALYLNNPKVQKAIHVDVAKKSWHICGGIQYNSNQGSLLPSYKDIIIPAIKVLIFNGDADCCVPYKGNEWWTSSLGLPLAEGGGWRQWSVDNQLAGYVTSYKQDFSFLTVKGSGHMVPQFRPKPALAMFERFVSGVAFDCEGTNPPSCGTAPLAK